MRLPSIIALLTLVLLAGVVSVRVLETRLGGATVPGLVLLDAEALDEAALRAIAREYPSARVESVPASRDPLAPFDTALIERLRGRGDATALFTLRDEPDGPLGARLWTKRRTKFPLPEHETVIEEGAAYLAGQHTTQAFCLAVVLPPETDPGGLGPIRALEAATEHLPDFRRCSLVLLGARRADLPGERWSLRIDTGRWVRPGEPGLADLLAARW